MKIATVTISYNEDYQFDNWKSFYDEYKDEISLHIIVDNNSHLEYREKIKAAFPDSTIIENNKNTGTTGAYNLGVKHALKAGADAIMFISQDIRIKKGSILKLYETLFSHEKIGMTAPLLLSGKDREIIEEYGGIIDPKTMGVTKNFIKCNINTNMPEKLEVNFIAGGINMVKSEVYKKIGFLDEDLFMYGEEADWGLRVERSGYKMIVIKECISWHEHVYVSDTSGKVKFRSPMAFFLVNRNRLLLVRKYSKNKNLLFAVLKMFIEFPAANFRLLINFQFKRIFANFLGILYGATGKRTIPKMIL